MTDIKEAVEWDSVDWSNTHIDTSHGQFHIGTMDNDLGPRFVALAVGPDDGRTQIILLDDDDIDELFKLLRQEAKSL